MVAESGKDWYISDWDKPVELIEGIMFHVAQYLKDQGITLD